MNKISLAAKLISNKRVRRGAVKLLTNKRVRRGAVRLGKSPRVRRVILKQVARQLRR